jgi:ATP-dependent protease ClpP protease subunit
MANPMHDAYLSRPHSAQIESTFFQIPPIYLKFETGQPVICHVYINGIIESINEFGDVLHALRTLEKDDRMILYISSPGGNMTTGAVVASAVQVAKCHTTTVATGFVASAAALIWSSANICKMRPGSLLMMHCSSHMDFGNSLEIRDNANRLINYVKFILSIGALKKGHLLPEELDKIITQPGTEIYINYETMEERLKGKEALASQTYDPVTKEVEENSSTSKSQDFNPNQEEETSEDDSMPQTPDQEDEASITDEGHTDEDNKVEETAKEPEPEEEQEEESSEETEEEGENENKEEEENEDEEEEEGTFGGATPGEGE